MRSRLFHAIVIASTSFAGGCGTEAITSPPDGGPKDLAGVQGAEGGLYVVDGFGPPPDLAGTDLAGGGPVDMSHPVGVAPIDGFGPPPDIAKGFDGGVLPNDMGMTIAYDLYGQKDLP